MVSRALPWTDVGSGAHPAHQADRTSALAPLSSPLRPPPETPSPLAPSPLPLFTHTHTSRPPPISTPPLHASPPSRRFRPPPASSTPRPTLARAADRRRVDPQLDHHYGVPAQREEGEARAQCGEHAQVQEARWKEGPAPTPFQPRHPATRGGHPPSASRHPMNPHTPHPLPLSSALERARATPPRRRRWV